MWGRATGILGIGAMALNGAAIAQDSEQFANSEAIADQLQTNVTCDPEMATEALTLEIASFGASREEIVEALRYTSLDEASCEALKTASSELQTLAETEPNAFDEIFGLVLEPSEAQLAAMQAPAQSLENASTALEKPLRPPRFTLLKTRSSY